VPVQIRGNLDRVDGDYVEGWITCVEAPELKFSLEIWLDHNLIGHCAADMYRQDLVDSNIGDGHCAFSFKFPSFIPASQVNQIKLKLANSDITWQPKNMPSTVAAVPSVVETLTNPSRSDALWIDRPDWIDTLAGKVRAGVISDELSVAIFKFCRDGYYVIPGAVSAELIVDLAREVDQIWKSQPDGLLIETFEPDDVMKYIKPNEKYRGGRTKLLDLHAHSALAREAIAALPVIEFLSAIFDDTPKAFQSLYFDRGTQQPMHKDSAYVKVDTNPSSLLATWLALDDLSPGTGELEFYIGSHRAPDFLFGGYSKWMEGFANEHDNYLLSLHDDADALGQIKGSFLAKKGDVLIWHANLAYGDTRVTKSNRTRRSLATHFTAAEYEPLYRRDSHFEELRTGSCVFVSQYGDIV
jgi:hypothetical protein